MMIGDEVVVVVFEGVGVATGTTIFSGVKNDEKKLLSELITPAPVSYTHLTLPTNREV